MIVDRISGELGVDQGSVWSIINSANYLYKFYRIRKRSGGYRNIYHPAKRLKAIQRWTGNRIFGHLPIHHSATAYVKGKSIKDNAMPHTQSNYIQKIDFTDFFESITGSDIMNLLLRHSEALSLSRDDSRIICRIVCRHNRLTIGAPSSPIISNVMLFDFDHAVSTFSAQHNMTYTRYADDLTFSSTAKNVVGRSIDFVQEQITKMQYPRLVINQQKLVSVSKKRRRTVTGLTLTTDGKVSISRSRKREIRALIHRYINASLEPGQLDYLRGLLAYLFSIEPDVVTALRTKYGDATITELLRHKKPTIQ